MIIRVLPYLLLLLLHWSCQSESAAEKTNASQTSELQSETPAIVDSAQWIVEKAIAVHGGRQLAKSTVAFDFRKRHYIAKRDNGQFQYERIFTGEDGVPVRDILTNKGITRELGGQSVTLSAKDSSAYSNSVNSVVYFALLPYFLNDPAVKKSYLGQVSIKGKPYHKIKVSFQQDGGGKDFEDEYVYWFHRDSYTMDYLAYNYQVDGGGARFRVAYNFRIEKGIRFADYRNMKPTNGSMDVEQFDRFYEEGLLEEISLIETENISVELF